MRAIGAVVAAVTLLAAGCTQSDSEGGDSGGGDGTPAASSGELGRGVTEDSVKIGYAYLDFDPLVEQGLAPQGWGDQELAFQAQVDAANEAGGINGRQIEVVYGPYSPLGTESAEAACLELTQDEEVFAVVGGFLGPAEPANACIVGQQSTALIGGVQSQERLDDAEAPWLTDRPLRTRQADILFGLLDDEDMLADANIAVVTAIDAEDVRESVIEGLAEYDVDPVSDLLSDVDVGDITAEDNAWATFAERIRSDGADTVLLVGNPSAGIRNIAAQGLDVNIWVLDQETLINLGATVDLEDARGTLAAASMANQELWDDETSEECRENYTAANPDVEIPEPEDLVEGEENIPQGILTSCRFFQLFRTVAEQAGPDLNNDTLATKASELDQFTLPGQPFASFTEDKRDANDSFRLVSFDPDLGQGGGFENLTDIVDVTP